MEPKEVAMIIGVVTIVLAAAVWVYFQRQRSSKLRTRFGPEYERLVKETGNQRRAETLLEKRQQRVKRLAIHSLNGKDRQMFLKRWRQAQARFVDDPRTALEDADDMAHDITVKHRRDGASTEELRQALVLYRELFEELLETNESVIPEEKHESALRR